MNYVKIQGEIIKEILKRKHNTSQKQVMYDDMNDTGYIGIMPSPFYAYVFLRDLFCIDTSKMIFTTTLAKLYDRREKAKPLTDTNTTEEIDKGVYRVYKTELGEKVYINIKYAKDFGSPSDLYFKTEGVKSVVYVYEKKTDFLIGYIMPFTRNKN